MPGCLLPAHLLLVCILSVNLLCCSAVVGSRLPSTPADLSRGPSQRDWDRLQRRYHSRAAPTTARRSLFPWSKSHAEGSTPFGSELATVRDARVAQREYCAANFSAWQEHTKKGNAFTDVQLSDFDIYVYSTGDIVSTVIRGSGGWEGPELAQLFIAMDRPLKLKAGGEAKAVAFVDIGSNIGWFALNFACRGVPTFAFEAMASNQELTRGSLCENALAKQAHKHKCMHHMTFFAYGLGAKQEKCKLVSHHTNQGDCHTVCGDGPMPASFSTYTLRNEFEVRRLDELIDFDVKALKMDVEGHEPSVWEGMTGLLAKRKVYYVVMEYFPALMTTGHTRDAAKAFPKKLAGLGYRISRHSFDGPWLSDADVDNLFNLVPFEHPNNLFLKHVDLE